jgi:Zn-dependent metalloprotease
MADNGGVHINSGIVNQAFYLAVESGTNRTSNLAVQGVGSANREQMEKVFYRAFTQMLPSNANFSLARDFRRRMLSRLHHSQHRVRRLGAILLVDRGDPSGRPERERVVHR